MSPLGSVAVAVKAAAVADGKSAACCSFWGALWTVILAGMAPADVFNPKHLHHSQLSIIALQLKIAHYREIPSNIARYLQISPITFKKLRYPRIS